MRYFVIRVTRTEDRYAITQWGGGHPDNLKGYSWYHAGGRGNGAFANMYEEKQVNRILGKYKDTKGMKAEAVEVSFKEGS